MNSRFLLCALALLLLLVSLSVKGDELIDPLRGVSVDQLLNERGDVVLIKINNAHRGPYLGFCQYEYDANVIRIYRNSEYIYNENVSFSTSLQLRIDDYFVILRNNNSNELDYNEQIKCQAETKKRLGKKSFMIRQDELLSVYEFNEEYYAFLPYRRFWSDLPGVFDRQVNLPDDSYYTMLRSAGGIADGKFVRLDQLLYSISPTK